MEKVIQPVVQTMCVHGSMQVNLSSFSYLFSEIIQYTQSRVSNIGELERR